MASGVFSPACIDESYHSSNPLAPRVLRSGAEIIDGVSKGKTWKQSAKDTVRSQLPEYLTKIAFGDETQSGSGLCRKRTLQFGKQKKAKRVKRDIFS
jgi:hypothetical protein